MDKQEKRSLYTGYTQELVPTARMLRKGMTDQERHLWYDFLRTYPMKFYRQRPIGGYIADFYCKKARLVIELDGSQHFTDEGIMYDEARTRAINAFGLTVLRFSNADINNNFHGVCTAIDEYIKRVAPLKGKTLPSGERCRAATERGGGQG